MGLFEKIFLRAIFLSPYGVDSKRIPVYKLLPDSPSAVAHGTTAGHFPKQLMPTHPFPEEMLVV